MTLRYFTPSTIEEMYKDLEEARLNLLDEIVKEDSIAKKSEYRKLTACVMELSGHYQNLTGDILGMTD